jgi:hypothetical protein
VKGTGIYFIVLFVLTLSVSFTPYSYSAIPIDGEFGGVPKLDLPELFPLPGTEPAPEPVPDPIRTRAS